MSVCMMSQHSGEIGLLLAAISRFQSFATGSIDQNRSFKPQVKDGDPPAELSNKEG